MRGKSVVLVDDILPRFGVLFPYVELTLIYTFGYGAIASKKVEVHVNGRDVSQHLTQQGDFENGSVLTVMGSMKQLNLNIGDNQVFLKIGDFVTKPCIFKSFKVL